MVRGGFGFRGNRNRRFNADHFGGEFEEGEYTRPLIQRRTRGWKSTPRNRYANPNFNFSSARVYSSRPSFYSGPPSRRPRGGRNNNINTRVPTWVQERYRGNAYSYGPVRVHPASQQWGPFQNRNFPKIMKSIRGSPRGGRGGRGARGGRGGRGRGRGGRPDTAKMDAQLDAYMGEDVAKNRLDMELDAYFGRSNAEKTQKIEVDADGTPEAGETAAP